MKTLSFALGAALAAGLAPTASRPGPIDVGDVASYAFRDPPLNALGAKSLEDLRGKPVLFDFWGTR